MNTLNRLGASAVRVLAGFAVQGGSRAKLSILIYHQVNRIVDPLLPGEVDAERFDWQMYLLSKAFNVLPLDEAVSKLATGQLPPRAACVTFDDGFADNYTVALPILQKYRLPVTVFVADAYLDGGLMWNNAIIETVRRVRPGVFDLDELGLGQFNLSDDVSRRQCLNILIGKLKHKESDVRQEKVGALVELADVELPNDLMMTGEQLRAMSDAGVVIGGHTRTHPILTKVSEQQARAEIMENREVLQSLTGQDIKMFAYPNGKPGQDYDSSHVSMVKAAGYQAAVSTAVGVSTRERDPYQLARYTPWGRNTAHFGARMLQNALAGLNAASVEKDISL